MTIVHIEGEEDNPEILLFKKKILKVPKILK